MVFIGNGLNLRMFIGKVFEDISKPYYKTSLSVRALTLGTLDQSVRITRKLAYLSCKILDNQYCKNCILAGAGSEFFFSDGKVHRAEDCLCCLVIKTIRTMGDVVAIWASRFNGKSYAAKHAPASFMDIDSLSGNSKLVVDSRRLIDDPARSEEVARAIGHALLTRAREEKLGGRWLLSGCSEVSNIRWVCPPDQFLTNLRSAPVGEVDALVEGYSSGWNNGLVIVASVQELLNFRVWMRGGCIVRDGATIAPIRNTRR
jgi:hypothetical protein